MAINFFPQPGLTRPPHRAVSAHVLRVIRTAIIAGWELVRTDPPGGFNLATANEDTVTTVLHNTLVNRVLCMKIVPGFSPDLFRVSRTPKVYSYCQRALKTSQGWALENQPF